ncbi:SipW-dependent-type signal peptide-containing protein [Rhodococcus sp. OK302]|uniref:SipW-dependent-type signal peptide-containing protein n=1 Tax=Rhodococcus sp. OK302 TaxID=1882769 RepID=UPI000B94167B|nr:SipW-dependent-type signal peptide-containing protein [Rhodococcus sp. OK302]OYD66700.1 putative ribosomally synthesized peptide with SipW-like signal peptide [Rhodococcus sp. OK302]
MPTQQKSGGDVRLGARMRGRIGETGWNRARAVLSLGMVLGLGAVGTMAAWTDSATATTGMFSTSSILLKVDDQHPAHAFTTLKRSSMMPGDSVAASLKVENAGTLNFTWAVSAVATGSPELIGKLKVALHQTAANDGITCQGPIITAAQPFGGTLATGRPLAAGVSEQVCVKVTVDSSAGLTERFKIADLGFNFTAVAP